VTLEQQSNREIITSNSDEFLEFISKFNKVKNKYNNYEFIYIKDIEHFNRTIESEFKEIQPIKRNIKIKISGRCFKEGITALISKSKSRSPKISCQLIIDIVKNPEFLRCDLKDELEIIDEISGTIIFRGNIKNYYCSDNKATIIAQDISLKLENTRIQGMEFHNMSFLDQMQIMISPFEKIKLDPALSPKNKQRDFKIIVPIKNLLINDAFKIGDVEFYQDFSSLDDSFIKNSDNGRNNPTWNGNLLRAKVTVSDEQFISAIMSGYEKISRAVDVIAFRTNLSCQTFNLNGETKYNEFDYYKLISQVSIPYWIYCREINTQSFSILNIEYLTESILALEQNSSNYFNILNQIFGRLLIQSNLTQEEKNLLQVIHWIRRAIESKDKRDKLLDLWTAMEFLVSGTNVKKLFTKFEIKRIKNILDNNISISDEQRSALFDKLDMLNNAPIMEKFKIIAQDAGLELTESEKKLIDLTRSKRNLIIHGKKEATILDEELNKLLSVIEVVLLYKLDHFNRSN